MERFHNYFGVGLVEPVVGSEIEINRPDEIIRAHQFAFLLPGEVAEVNETKLAVGYQDAQGACVFGDIHRTLRLRIAYWIGLAPARQWSADLLSRGSQDLRAHVVERQPVAWFHCEAFALRHDFFIGRITFTR